MFAAEIAEFPHTPPSFARLVCEVTHIKDGDWALQIVGIATYHWTRLSCEESLFSFPCSVIMYSSGPKDRVIRETHYLNYFFY